MSWPEIVRPHTRDSWQLGGRMQRPFPIHIFIPFPTGYSVTFHLVIIYSKVNREIIRAVHRLLLLLDPLLQRQVCVVWMDGVEYYTSISYCISMIKYLTGRSSYLKLKASLQLNR